VRRVPTLKCQEALGSNEPSQAWQVIGAVARVEAATRMDRPHGQAAAIRLLLRLVVPLVPPVVWCSSWRHKVIAVSSKAMWLGYWPAV
jgi:hypothetical protein